MQLMRLGLVLCAACGGGEEASKTGHVSLVSQFYVKGGSTTRHGSAVARFQLPPEACTERVVDDACKLVECVPVASGDLVSAGTITVTGAAVPITLVPATETEFAGGYTSVSSTQPLFMGDETFAVTGSGAEVPTFALTLVAPSQPTITVPAKPADNVFPVVDRTTPFHVEWTTATGAGMVSIGLGNATSALDCGYPASDMRADIPVSALAMVPPGFRDLRAGAASESTTEAGDWHVVARASVNALWPDNSEAIAQVIVQ
jgi:hypothetical protein